MSLYRLITGTIIWSDEMEIPTINYKRLLCWVAILVSVYLILTFIHHHYPLYNDERKWLHSFDVKEETSGTADNRHNGKTSDYVIFYQTLPGKDKKQ